MDESRLHVEDLTQPEFWPPKGKLVPFRCAKCGRVMFKRRAEGPKHLCGECAMWRTLCPHRKYPEDCRDPWCMVRLVMDR